MAPIATTTDGDVEGREKNGSLLFAGIPYAAPPVGALRFQPTQPVEPWTGVREAKAFGPQAPQAAGALGGLLSQDGANASEDCLTLNVMTPALDDARRPVLFWIHGGGFVGGTGATPWYDGRAFVGQHDCVVVTINYRLGALGFLHLAELGGEAYASSGVNGILDQVAALRWVQANIESFGGDPGNVTIFGESAGGMSVSTLLGLPAAAGLFHKAAPQSGAAHFVLPPDEAARRTARFCELADLGSIEDVLAADVDLLVETQAKLTEELRKDRRGGSAREAGILLGLPFQPVLDGVHLPVPPLDAVRAGSARDVALLTGTNLDEWNLFALMLGHPDEAKAVERLDRVTGGEGRSAYDTYAAARPDATPTDVFNAAFTDLVFRVPAIRLAEAHRKAAAPGVDTRMYLFTHPSSAFDGRLGSCHALEIPFVFQSIGRAGTDFFLGHEPPPNLAPAMNAAWAAFARTGDPSVADLPEWPVYEESERATMVLDADCAATGDPSAAERRWWDGHL